MWHELIKGQYMQFEKDTKAFNSVQLVFLPFPFITRMKNCFLGILFFFLKFFILLLFSSWVFWIWHMKGCTFSPSKTLFHKSWGTKETNWGNSVESLQLLKHQHQVTAGAGGGDEEEAPLLPSSTQEGGGFCPLGAPNLLWEGKRYWLLSLAGHLILECHLSNKRIQLFRT